MSSRLFVSREERQFYLVLGCLVLAAWVLLFAWQKSAYAELFGHEAVGDHSLPPSLRLATFLLSWFLMTVAMMLPGNLALLNQSVRPLRRWTARRWLEGLTIFGYLAPWILFGLLVYLGDNILHHLAEEGEPLATFSGWIAPAIMLVAGLYQFSPGKRSFMNSCQISNDLTPQAHIGKLNRIGAVQWGLKLGVFCVGSCWSLMLLMFAVGHHRLDWMLALSVVMAAERLSPWGHRLSWLVGFALIVWAAIWLLALPHGGHSHL